jgi:hypothetical protein
MFLKAHHPCLQSPQALHPLNKRQSRSSGVLSRRNISRFPAFNGPPTLMYPPPVRLKSPAGAQSKTSRANGLNPKNATQTDPLT